MIIRIRPLLFTVTVLVLSQASGALAASCTEVANQEAANLGGEAINVVAKEEGGKTTCEITIRIPNTGQPPRVVIRKISG